MKPAVLFDFDGTVMDSEPAVIASYMHVFEIYAEPEEFTPERQVEVIGPPLDQKMKVFFPDADVNEVMEEYRAFQTEHLGDLMKPMQNAKELLEWLKESGYQTGIVTARLRSSLEHILEVFRMDHYFDVLVCHDDGIAPKPSPEGILLAEKKLGAVDSIYVGDSGTDILAGRAAGIPTVAVLTHPKKETEVLAQQPDYAVRDLMEIRVILEHMPE